MALPHQREHLAASMRMLLRYEPLIGYTQLRPMRTRRLLEQDAWDLLDGGGRLRMDCSETVTLLCRWGGLADPNGQGYNGTGYTGTMLANLPHYDDPKGAATGALVVYGPGVGEHVSMVLEPGADPLLFSHGSDAGPRLVKLSLERTWHQPPVRFLSIAKL